MQPEEVQHACMVAPTLNVIAEAISLIEARVSLMCSHSFKLLVSVHSDNVMSLVNLPDLFD